MKEEESVVEVSQYAQSSGLETTLIDEIWVERLNKRMPVLCLVGTFLPNLWLSSGH